MNGRCPVPSRIPCYFCPVPSRPAEGVILVSRPVPQRDGTGRDGINPASRGALYATTRYPFAPFSITFNQQVRDKMVIENLIKHASEKHKFELKTVAYRRGHAENNECRMLVFVENSESFAFLYDQNNWPTALAGHVFTTKRPAIPPQLSAVMPAVPLQIEWEDFVQEIQQTYPNITKVIRLKNQSQQPVKAVKLEFLSPGTREEILSAGEISVMHMKLKVVEYFAHANVLICSNCCGIGHFRKNCPEKEVTTCKTCGEKHQNLEEHQCSGILKCIHCGGAHISNDSRCKVVRDYRAALTRNLLARVVPETNKETWVQPTPMNAQCTTGDMGWVQYSNADRAQPQPQNLQDIIVKKLDSVISKMDEESIATRVALKEIKDEMRNRYDEMKQKVEAVEEKVEAVEKRLEKKVDEVVQSIATIMQNVCTSLLDPIRSQDSSWKVYWQEQIKALTELKLSLKTCQQ